MRISVSFVAMALPALLCVSVAAQEGVSPASSRQEALAQAIKKATAAQQANDYQAASENYRLAAGVSPETAELWANLGITEHLSGQFAQAIADFHHALRLKPALFVPNLFLGVDLVNTQHAEQAVPYLLQAKTLKPGDPLTSITLGRAYALLHRASASTQAYQEATRLAPANASAWFGLGVSYLKQIEDDARRLTTAYPGSVYLQALAGESLGNEGKYTEAARAYAAVIDSAQAPICMRTEYVRLMTKAGNEAAVQDLVADLPQKDPHCPLALFSQPVAVTVTSHLAAAGLAARLFYAGQYAEASQAAGHLASGPSAEAGLYWAIRANQHLAVAALDRTAELDDNSANIHVLLGDVYRQLQRYPAAEAQYHRALAISPNHPAALLGLSALQFMQGALDQSFATATIAFSQNPKDSEINLLMAEVLVERHDYPAALAHLDDSLKAPPELLPRVHALRGRIYASQNRTAEAIRELEMALPADEDGSAHYQLALLYKKQGETGQAKTAMQASERLHSEQLRRASVGLADGVTVSTLRAEVE